MVENCCVEGRTTLWPELVAREGEEKFYVDGGEVGDTICHVSWMVGPLTKNEKLL